MQSQVRQNYAAESEAAINKQINRELKVSYAYQSMAFYFDRDDVALKGFYRFFKQLADEEREHAEKFMKYQNRRGGRIVLEAIDKPANDAWNSGLQAMEAALDMEKDVNQALLDLHKAASANNDPQLTDFLEHEYLDEQVESMKMIGDHITNLRRVGTGLGEYQFDKLTLKE